MIVKGFMILCLCMYDDMNCILFGWKIVMFNDGEIFDYF